MKDVLALSLDPVAIEYSAYSFCQRVSEHHQKHTEISRIALYAYSLLPLIAKASFN